MRFVLAFLVCSLIPFPVIAASVRGHVQNAEETVLEQARVRDVHGEREVFTDSRGNFQLDCASPCLLLVTHPRFTEQAIEVDEAASQPLTIILTAKQEIFEQITVTASRSNRRSFRPESVAVTAIMPQEKAAPPTTLTELVEGVAGVAENGQGGIFQVFSVRGVSRQRILTLVSGIQVIGERRAGVSTSFIDPLLMGEVDVLRGPASTHYGSGALGGVVQIFPRQFETFRFESGYSSLGDENYQVLGWGDDTWSLGFARRAANNSETADGTEINTHFLQYSASIARRWQAGDKFYEILAMPSTGDDIGKSSLDFPDSRITNYPDENHLLLKFGITDDSGWAWNTYIHPNDLETETLRVDSRLNLVKNKAFDFGSNWQREWATEKLAGSYGVDYDARRGVNARESEERFSSGEITELQTLDDAEQDQAALFGSMRWNWGATKVQVGSRLTWQRQNNTGFNSEDDTAWTGFVGLVRPIGKGFELAANLGTGLRFPNLSERFFSGTTGRGGVTGNPNLDSERSISSEIGARWYGKKGFLSTQIFHLKIDDYIERVEIEPDLLTFVNLISGTIDGFELEGSYQLSEPWALTWSGHLIDGESDDGSPLADIAANRAQFGLKYRHEKWDGRLNLQLRDSKDDPGPSEVAIPAAQLVSAAFSYQLRPGLRLNLRGENLLDEAYFNSADDKVTQAEGRSFAVGFSWQH